MQQVASSRSNVSSSPYTSRQLTACLRLTRGSSAQATWLLEDVPGGTTIQIGGDGDCDWQLRAACVPDHALTAMLVGGTLFAKSATESTVLLNGKPLALQWTEVGSGSRIDIGLARIDVALGEADSAFAGRVPDTFVPAAVTAQELPLEAKRTLEYRMSPEISAMLKDEQRGQAAATFAEIAAPQEMLREALHAPAIQAEHEPPQVARSMDEPRPSVLPDAGRTSFMGRLSGRWSRPSLHGAPSLFEEGARPQQNPNLWKIAVGGVLTVLAYGGWVFLLDHM